MDDKKLKKEYYFENLEGYKHFDLFKDTNYIWEAILNLDEYVERYSNIACADGNCLLIKTGRLVTIEGECAIGKGTEIHSNVVIEGPVIIGENCTIMPGAFIRPNTVIGDNCVIGHGCEIKHSILMDNAKTQSFTFIGDSIIGDSGRVGSGTVIANRRFDQKNIGIKVDGVYHSYNTSYFGCVLGDNSRIGANCTINPGTLIGMYTWISSMTSAGGLIESEKLIENADCKKIIYDKMKVKLK